MLALWEYFWPLQLWAGLKPSPQPDLTLRYEEIGPMMYLVRTNKP